MLITSHLFEAYLKCHTKCFLRSLGETTTENCYSDWVQDQQASYRCEEIKRLTQGAAQNQCVTGPIDRENVQSAKWRFAIETTARAQNLESTIHAVARVTSQQGDIHRHPAFLHFQAPQSAQESKESCNAAPLCVAGARHSGGHCLYPRNSSFS